MKNDGRAIAHDVLEKYRFSAIRLHKSGVPVETIAGSFRVTRQAVYRWIRNAKVSGQRGLRSSKADGPPSLLTCAQWKTLRDLIRKPATKLGYSTDLWSGPRVRHVIKHQFRIEYHAKHMPRLLKRLGLELKFPERRALEQDAQEVQRWKRSRLPEILHYARKRGAILFYADEALISLIPYVGKSWALPGTKPIARVSGMRGQHVGVTAAVNQQGRMCFELTRDKERFTAKVFLRFIRKMHREFPWRFIVLIADGASVHTANVVKKYVAENKSWFRLEILPAYSPELNPTEQSWRFIKTKKLNGSTARNKSDLRIATRKAMRETKKSKKRVVSFFDQM